MGQGLGLGRQAGVFPLSDRFAEMGGIPANDDGGEQVEPGHAVVLAFAPIDSSGNSAACMPPASIPSAISPNSSPSQDQPSIAHSTGAFPLSPNPPMETDGRRKDSGRGVKKLQTRRSGLEFG